MQSRDKHSSAPETIESNEALITVIDKATGIAYERLLPISYFESANGIRLVGETIDGKPCEMAFLSERAVGLIKDHTGGGPDSPREECPNNS